MKAVNDRILIQKGIIPERTVGGIFIAAGVSTDAKVKLNIGKVLSVGGGIRFHDGYTVKPECSEGDIIMWEQFGDIQAEILGENRVCVRWEDVICKLGPDEVKGWIFDPEEYRKIQAENQKKLDEEKKKIRDAEETASALRVIRSCRNKNCHQINRPIENKETCEYCGDLMTEVEGHVAPSIFVRGGASPGRV